MYAKKMTAAPAPTPAKPLGAKGCQFSGAHEPGAGQDEECQDDELHADHDRVETRRLLHAPDEDDRDGGDDAEREGVEDDGHAQDVRRARQEPGRGRGGPVVGHEPSRQVDADAAEERVGVAGPRDGDGRVADGVLEEEVPADDPGDQLAQRRVGVRVGAARHGDHRGELGVAERREAADDRGQHERQPSAPVRRRGGSRRLPRRVPMVAKMPVPMMAPTPSAMRLQGPEHLLERGSLLLGLREDGVDRLGAEDLQRHARRRTIPSAARHAPPASSPGSGDDPPRRRAGRRRARRAGGRRRSSPQGTSRSRGARSSTVRAARRACGAPATGASRGSTTSPTS